MRREINALEARQRFGELLDRVYYKDDQIVIKRRNKPMAVIISPQAYEQYLKQRQKDFEVLDRIWAKMPPISQEEAEREAEALVEEVRAERRFR